MDDDFNNIEKCDMSKFVYVKDLGEGSQAYVKQYSRVNGGPDVAIKKRKFQTIESFLEDADGFSDELTEEFFYAEALALYKLRKSKYFPYLHCVHIDDSKGEYLMAMELIEGKPMINDDGDDYRTLTDEEMKNFAFQLINALTDLKNMNMVHRDIKLSNMIFTKEGKLKIFDLGIVELNPHYSDGPLVGSPIHMAPEVARQDRDIRNADWFSAGITVYEINYLNAYGTNGIYTDDEINIWPFIESYHDNVWQEKKEEHFKIEIPQKMNLTAYAFAKSLMIIDPHKRHGHTLETINSLKQHEYIKFYADLEASKIQTAPLPTSRTVVTEPKPASINHEALYISLSVIAFLLICLPAFLVRKWITKSKLQENPPGVTEEVNVDIV